MRIHEAYVLNTGAVKVAIAHNVLSGLSALMAVPGGFVPVVGKRAEIEPGQAIKLPMRAWNTGKGLWRVKALTQISKEQFEAMYKTPADVELPPPPPDELADVLEDVEPEAELVEGAKSEEAPKLRVPKAKKK